MFAIKKDRISVKWIASIMIFAVMLISVMVIKMHRIDLVDIIPSYCILYQKYGFYCTGCGGTRACMALLRGHLIESLRYHPVILYTAGLVIYYFVMNVLNYVRQLNRKIVKPIHFYIMIAVILIQWIIKNMALLLFDYRIL